MGNEDQGWVAHAPSKARRHALRGRQAVHGVGVLYVEDLVDEFLHVCAEMPRIAGQAFTAHNVIRKLQLTAYAERQRLTERGVIDPSMLYTHQFVIDALSEAFKFLESRLEGFVKAWIRTAA